MKKSLFFVIVCLICSTVANAQDAKSGIKGGFNFSTLYVDDVEDRQIRPGFHAGVFTQIPLVGPLSIQPELMFTTAGNRTKVEFGIFDYEVDYNLNYIQLPVLVNLEVGNTISLQGGFYAAYLVGGNISYEGDLNSTTELDRDDFSKLDIGFSAGVGYNINNIQFGLRYNLGLREIADSDSARDDIGNVKNVVGQIYMAINLSGS
ncbi:MAG: porin family protein [Cyclobacteriaceae bacterium]